MTPDKPPKSFKPEMGKVLHFPESDKILNDEQKNRRETVDAIHVHVQSCLDVLHRVTVSDRNNRKLIDRALLELEETQQRLKDL